MPYTDYISDVPYTAGYYGVINPMHMRFTLLARGVVPGQGGRVLELGYGQGLSLMIHGAASDGEHWGIDFNAAHAAFAQELIATAELPVHALEASFEELLERRDLPQFDAITLHGIYSWVSPANRHAIVEILRRHLKPGGVCYISYNCWPGWGASGPLRHLLKVYADKAVATRPLLQQIADAMAFAAKVEAAGARYFKAVPEAGRRLKQLETKDRRYLAHEFLNSEWTPMPFDRVAEDLRAAKLEFACSAHLLDLIDSLNLTQEMRTLLDGIEEPILRETVRDYCINQQFRRDLFVRGLRLLSPLQHQDLMLEARFVLLTQPKNFTFEVSTSLGKATLEKAVYEPVIEVLTEDGGRPKSLCELLADRRLGDIGYRRVAQAMIVLCGNGLAHPAQTEAAAAAAVRPCQRLNKAIIERSRATHELFYLASPVTGGGIAVSPMQQHFLDAIGQGRKSPHEMAAYAWTLLKRRGHRVKKDDKVLQTDGENVEELSRQAGEFANARLPVLRQLGCIA
jgi:SAM-dependent methyltransferase